MSAPWPVEPPRIIVQYPPVLLLAAGVAGLISKGQVQQASPAPEQTVANLKKDIEEVKEARHDRA